VRLILGIFRRESKKVFSAATFLLTESLISENMISGWQERAQPMGVLSKFNLLDFAGHKPHRGTKFSKEKIEPLSSLKLCRAALMMDLFQH
jgi:hypothetical protein